MLPGLVDARLHAPLRHHASGGFATLHAGSTLMLMDLLEKGGLVAYVGKVNMDRNGSDELCEASTAASLADTVRWLDEAEGRGYELTRPILTPRFTPSCSDELMRRSRSCGAMGPLRRTVPSPTLSSPAASRPFAVTWMRA